MSPATAISWSGCGATVHADIPLLLMWTHHVPAEAMRGKKPGFIYPTRGTVISPCSGFYWLKIAICFWMKHRLIESGKHDLVAHGGIPQQKSLGCKGHSKVM